MQGDVKDVLLLDVTPLSLGIETLGGVSTVLLAKNTTIPASKSQVFSTAADNQTSVEVHVLQGERPIAQDNKSLGRFILDGIPPGPRGTPQVEVIFDIDANGIFNVTAKDKTSGKTQSIRIEGSTGITPEEVERMKQEAEANQEQDKKKQELIEARNAADTIIYTAEKSVRDAGDKVGDEVKKEIEEKLEALKKAKESDSIEEIQSATESVSQVLQKVGAAISQNAEAESSSADTAEQANQPHAESDEENKESKDESQEGEYREKQ